ncbi:neural cell adhesion molecule 1-like isoform X2 [Sparus aurata]|uniref:Neural cell adhesion molecule 3 n=1 Tax=Sparus aurata TaxID=8175 RepID=A0A671WIV9_SPAAU|nr:neural cell adhesion molecule 1-like isoform X2 [Sparus aurata]
MNQSALILRTALLLLLLLMYGTDARNHSISINPDVLVGEEIIVSCNAGAEGEITWFKDGKEINDEEKVLKVDGAASKMIIKKATMQDAGRYTCHCKFNSGHTDETEMQLYVYEGPSFGQTTTYHEFLEGTDGEVPCLVTGQPAVDVKWLKDKQEIPSHAGSHMRQLRDNKLLIKKVKREDAGTYECRAQIKGRPISKLLSVSVVVNAPPTVQFKEKEKKVWAEPETNTTLVCLVDGHPQPNINWTMPNSIDPSRHHFNSDRSQLTIRSVTRADHGEYVCTATNKIAESSATIMLYVFDGGNPLQNFTIGCRQDKEGAEWKEMQLSPTTDSISLKKLCLGSGVKTEQPVSSRSMTEGTMIVIVMVSFLVVFLVIDATCFYRNQCGLLMFIAVKIFGYKVQGLKLLDKGERTTNAQVKLIRISTLRSSTAGVQTKEGGQLTEVTCDKAALTKHEKIQPDRDLPNV